MCRRAIYIHYLIKIHEHVTWYIRYCKEVPKGREIRSPNIRRDIIENDSVCVNKDFIHLFCYVLQTVKASDCFTLCFSTALTDSLCFLVWAKYSSYFSRKISILLNSKCWKYREYQVTRIYFYRIGINGENLEESTQRRRDNSCHICVNQKEHVASL